MVSVNHLPTECLVLILSFVHSPISFEPSNLSEDDEDEDDAMVCDYSKSLRNLQRASRVSKLWLSIAHPILWRHLNIWSYTGAKLVMESAGFGRFRTDELDLTAHCAEESEPESEPESGRWRGWRNDFLDLVKGLKGLRKIVLVSVIELADDRWVAEGSLKDLEDLSINTAFVRLRTPLNTPPTTFQLSTLNIGHLVDSPFFIKSLLSSSSNSLTSLKLHPSPSIFSALLATLPLLANSLKSFHLAGKLPGLDTLLPQFKLLHTFHLELLHEDESTIDSINFTLLALPSPVVNVKILFRNREEEMVDVVRHFNKILRDGSEGWKRLNVLHCQVCTLFKGVELEEDIQSGDGWAELAQLCEDRGVMLSKDTS
ncbi:hypothetical protein P7C70_g7078, partial [Phenoliferia sp. Uapishka_3]